MLKTIKDLKDLKGKRVLLRADFNVPLDKDGDILDENRITAELPTIAYLIKQGARVIICSHLGRPKGYDKYLSLFSVAVCLMKHFPNKVKFCDKTIGPEAEKMAKDLKDGEILLLENTRFDPREKENDRMFAESLAKLADIYVNDAFASAHRKHASTYGVATKLPSAIGFLVEKEVRVFEKALSKPQRPFVAIFGGAKVEDKLGMISSVLDKADVILIGGAMAYTFLLSKGHNVGNSMVALDRVNDAYQILKKAEAKGVKIVLPVDHVALNEATGRVVKTTELGENLNGRDIGAKTIKLFCQEIAKAGQVIWNGPLGEYENPKYRKGTVKIAKAIAASHADSIIGGGDSVSAAKVAGVADKISYLSTGGGASLFLLEGKALPVLEVIDKI